MKIASFKKILPTILLVLLFFGTSFTTEVFAATPSIASAMTQSVIVQFAPTTTSFQETLILSSINAVVTRQLAIINGVEASVPATAVQALRNNPSILHVDANIALNLLDSTANTQIHADQVWSSGYTGSGARLAILDSGIDQSHQEFTGRIVACHSEITGIDCNPNNSPLGWHGTAVAGVASAQGLYAPAKGDAPASVLMSDKIVDPATDQATVGSLIAGIQWAVSNNARIINTSLGVLTTSSTQSNCNGDIPTLTSAINNAVAGGVTVVAASGNSHPAGNVANPACISSVVAVGAVDSSDHLAGFSDTGAAMTDHGVVAPGVNLVSTYPGGNMYATVQGTSFAAPMVSGMIALALSKTSTLSPDDIRALLFSISDCVQSPCPNNNIGHGRVNALRAINAGVTVSTSCDPTYCSGNPTTVFIYCTFYNGCSPPSASVSVTLTVNSVGGLSGNINLYYKAPSPNGGNSLTGPSSIFVPAGGSNTATLTASAWSQLGYWTWTIQAGNSGSLGSVPFTIHYYYCRCN